MRVSRSQWPPSLTTMSTPGWNLSSWNLSAGHMYDSGTEFNEMTFEGMNGRLWACRGIRRRRGTGLSRCGASRLGKMSCWRHLEGVIGAKWTVTRDSTKRLLESGRENNKERQAGWIFELVISQLFLERDGRGLVAAMREETDCELLEVRLDSASRLCARF